MEPQDNEAHPDFGPSHQVKLIQKYVQCRKALLEAEIIRSYKDPISEIAENIAKVFVRGRLAESKVQPQWDVCPSWEEPKIQVKSLSIPDEDTTNGVAVPMELKAYDLAVLRFDQFMPTRLLYVPAGQWKKAAEKGFAQINSKMQLLIRRTHFDKEQFKEPRTSITSRPSEPTVFHLDLLSLAEILDIDIGENQRVPAN